MTVDTSVARHRRSEPGDDGPGDAAARPSVLRALRRPEPLLVLALVVVAVRVTMTVVLPYERVVNLFEDDTYYYLGVARNIAAGAGSTFNGLDATNGYHPLWLLLLVPVLAVTESPGLGGRSVLVGVTVLSGALFVVSCLLLRRIGHEIRRPGLLAVASAPLLLAGTVGPSFWFNGMETGLLLTLLLAAALAVVRSAGRGRRTERDALLLGGVLALAVLARLDTVFLLAMVGAGALWTWRREPPARLVRLGLALGGPAVVLVGGYVLVNLAVFGTATPVSGQAKALGGAGGLNLMPVGQFLTSPLFVSGRPSMLGALALVVVPLALVARPRPAAPLTRFAGLVLLAALMTIAYYCVTSSWKLWPWYFATAPLALALAGPALLSRLRAVRTRQRLLGTVATHGVLLLAIANAAYLSVTPEIRGARIESAPALAAELAAVAPVDGPLAMGDWAGSVGYHLDRPLVHLEGLVGPAPYLDALATGRVGEFLRERGVALYARAHPGDGRPEPAAGPGCSRFTEPDQGAGPKFEIVVCADDLVVDRTLSDGSSFRVWRYRPELNGGQPYP